MPKLFSYRKQAPPLSETIPDALDLERNIPYRISSLYNLFLATRDRRTTEIAQFRPREIRLLITIGSYMPIRAANISYLTRLDTYTVSRGVSALKKQRWIETQSDPTDQRGDFIRLTEEGMDIYRKLTRSIEQRSRDLLSEFTETEVETLTDMLARLEDKIEEILAIEYQEDLLNGKTLNADQQETLRWYRRGL